MSRSLKTPSESNPLAPAPDSWPEWITQPHHPIDAATRETLLCRVKDLNNQDSWAEFFGIYRPLIYRTARAHRLDHHSSNEVLQETMLALTRAMPRFNYDRQRGSFRAWLKQRTRWTIYRHLTKNTRQPQTETFDEQAHDTTFENLWTTEWQNLTLDAALARVKTKITTRHLQIYCTVVDCGYNYARAALILGRTRVAIRLATSRVNRLLKKEVAKLKAEGF
jgi:RNA polymerase sigma-70 factor (ECF subfamily)